MYLYYYYFSIPMLMISNLMIMISNSNFFMWMIMEINLMCFMSILSIYKFMFSEIMMIYFITQAMNSYLFLMSSMLMNWNILNYMFFFMMLISLIAKMGLPPFHSWYLKMMKHLNWIIFFFNSSVQKFIPLIIISKFNQNNLLIKIISFILLMTIPFMSINSISLKLIMSYSSMIQILWILILMIINEKIWFTFFLFYNLISFNIYYLFYKLNSNYTFESSKMSPLLNMMINLMIVSFAGIPPFTGFLNKLMFFSMTSMKFSIYLNSLIMLFSLMNLFFYMRIIIASSLNFSILMNLNMKNLKMFNMNFLKISLISIFMLLLFTMIENF
uniref:NADH-ubiquinone oxidoreductase chain 2 n=1 Tax=Psyllaephagus populi TaxID=3122998 RepID=A0AAU7BN24_9HYME